MVARLAAPFLIAAQCLVAVGGAGALFVLPPASGELLLVPLLGQSEASVADLAIARGFPIVAKGGVSGSLIVRGDLAALGRPLRDHGLLVLGAGSQGCTRS